MTSITSTVDCCEEDICGWKDDYIISLEEECENLTEQIRMKDESIRRLLRNKRCRICDSPMESGYVIYNDRWEDYYCSIDCITVFIPVKDYEELNEAGMAYWTTWRE